MPEKSRTRLVQASERQLAKVKQEVNLQNARTTALEQQNKHYKVKFLQVHIQLQEIRTKIAIVDDAPL